MSGIVARHTRDETPAVWPVPEEDGLTISTGDFWPEIALRELRAAMRISPSVVTGRLQHIATEAALHVCDELADWRTAQTERGYTSLDAVPSAMTGDISALHFRYLHAVYCLTRAMLLERYRDMDTTRSGDAHAVALDAEIQDLWRDARYAITDIQGIARVQSEVF
ncbi:TPA: head completion/stabilization protein [Escherichia coli]|nr:head completion/stabilization protein [Escherichia coli]